MSYNFIWENWFYSAIFDYLYIENVSLTKLAVGKGIFICEKNEYSSSLSWCYIHNPRPENIRKVNKNGHCPRSSNSQENASWKVCLYNKFGRCKCLHGNAHSDIPRTCINITWNTQAAWKTMSWVRKKRKKKIYRPGLVRERASNACGRFSWKCGRFNGKEHVRKWGFLSWVWKAVDFSTVCAFIHIYGELL